MELRIKSAIWREGNMQWKSGWSKLDEACGEKVKGLIVLAESLSTLNMDEAEDWAHIESDM